MNFFEIAKQFFELVSKDLDKYTSEKSFIVKEGDYKVSLFTPSHIQFAKYGRGPGKKPPLDPILDWVSGNGIIFEGMDERGTALAIQASIGKNGTANWVPNAPNAIEEALDSSLKEYNESLAKIISIETSKQVEEIYKESFPDNQKFKI